MSSITTTTPQHIRRIAAEVLRVVARDLEGEGITVIHVDTLNAIAAAMDKQAGRQ